MGALGTAAGAAATANPWGAAIGAGVGLLSGIVNLIGAGAEKRKLEEVLKRMPENQYNKLVGMTQTQLQGRAPGMAEAERNIFQSGATALGRSSQAATSSADLLQQTAGIQEQTNKALENLGLKDIEDYQRRYGNYAQALQGKQEEDLRRYQMETAIRGAQRETMRNALMNLEDTGMGIASLAGKGAFNFGGGGSNNQNIGTQGTQNYGGVGLTGRGTPATVGGLPIPQNFLSMGYGLNNPYPWANNWLKNP